MNRTTSALTLRRLVKRYPGFTLGPLDLDVEPGRVLGVIGPNGAGKTTTLNCIAGLVVPDSGEIEVLGTSALGQDPKWKQNLGFLGEEQGSYRRWSVERNLRMMSWLSPAWSLDRAFRLAERLGLSLSPRVWELSRGNRTKLAFVMALAHGPRVLLLDEPTSGLDPVVRSEVLDLLWEIMEDGEHTIVYSTHVLSDIGRLADELLFIRDGQVLQRNPKDDLLDSWRRISFRLAQAPDLISGCIRHQRVRSEHQVVSSDVESTLAHLGELGAEAVDQSRMSIDEIAVEILKGERHVATR